jgi:hypothetical protein
MQSLLLLLFAIRMNCCFNNLLGERTLDQPYVINPDRARSIDHQIQFYFVRILAFLEKKRGLL